MSSLNGCIRSRRRTRREAASCLWAVWDPLVGDMLAPWGKESWGSERESAVPLVSVIVPVCNAERHLRECLASIQRQSLTDFELLLVDDGSTDSSPRILADFAATEPRARILQGPARGSAGAARNLGLAEAAGDYLAFFDADDYFLPTMLEELHSRAVATSADVVACKFFVYNDVTREVAQPDWMLQLEMLPKKRSFSPLAVGDELFAAFNPAAWNKLFRADFIRARGLKFQELRRTNDAYFTYMSLALAKRISYLDRHLLNYRVANSSSLQATVHQGPLEFVQALEAMRSTLTEAGLWPSLERAFSQLALNFCVGNLKRQSTPQSFLEVYEALRGGVFEQLGILDRPDSYFLRADHRQWRQRVLTETPTEYLFQRSIAGEKAADQSGFEAREATKQAAVRAGRPAEVYQAVPVAGEAREDDVLGEVGTPEVSVVIPVYNTVVYLVECVESVQRQTGCEVEIICIDDGSTDGSGEVLDRFAEADPRIRVVHQHNGGLSRARNAGLSMATGKYVCFLDSDDYWQGDALAELVRRADADALDVLLYDAVAVREPGVEDRLWAKYQAYYERRAYDGVVNGPRLMAAMQGAKEYREHACLYLIRRRFLTDLGLVFYPGITHEDNLFTFGLLLDAQRVGHSQLALYGRRLRPNSIVTAGSRVSAARGYFITWVEMLRLLRGRDLGDAEVSLSVGAITQVVYSSARRNASRLTAEALGRLAELDTDADAAALFYALKRSWTDDRSRRRLERQLKDAAAQPSSGAVQLVPVGSSGRSFARRVRKRLARMFQSK